MQGGRRTFEKLICGIIRTEICCPYERLQHSQGRWMNLLGGSPVDILSSTSPRDKRAQRTADFLGMPHGTAFARLRKNILFDLLQRHGENTCFKCGKLINTSDELSVEHKHPWEDRDPNLFWDLENIAFSHRKCNKPDRLMVKLSHRKSAPEGTSWCDSCNDFLPVENFHKNTKSWNGLFYMCKQCKNAWNRAHRQKQKLNSKLVL